MIQIFQIFYHEDQRVFLDDAFSPLDNSNKMYPYNYEYAVFFDLYKKTQWTKNSYLGALSWKFKQKTGLDGKTLLSMINENPGKDVYFVNPFPDQIIYENCWAQGEVFHQGITQLTQKLLEQVGYDPNILKLATAPRHLAYCNYWIANQAFWDSYMQFLMPIWNFVLSSDKAIASEMSKEADPIIKAPYLPFIFERLFSTYLTISSHTTLSLPLDHEYIGQSKYLSFFDSLFSRARYASNFKDLPYLQMQLLKVLYSVKKWKNYNNNPKIRHR